MLYLDYSCLNLSLGIFLEFFVIFRVFFVALEIYLDNTGFIFAQEKYFKKKNLLSNWAEPGGPTQLAPAHPRPRPAGQARQAHRPAMAAASQGGIAPRVPP
jgi:hypothetical protein